MFLRCGKLWGRDALLGIGRRLWRRGCGDLGCIVFRWGGGRDRDGDLGARFLEGRGG